MSRFLQNSKNYGVYSYVRAKYRTVCLILYFLNTSCLDVLVIQVLFCEIWFLPLDAARYCDCMSSVRPSVCLWRWWIRTT